MTQFAKSLDARISELVEKQDVFAAAVGETNHPVRTQRYGNGGAYPNHQKLPRSIYFYYIRYTPDAGLDVRHYFYPEGAHDDVANPATPAQWAPIPNTKAGLEPHIKKLIENAKANGGAGGNAYTLAGRDFQNIKWRRKSYIALFIDDEAWTLHKHSATGQDALIFLTDPAGPGLPNKTPNHSFFDAQVFDVTIAGRQRPVFVCINHMTRDEAGNNVTEHPQYFAFEIYFRAKFLQGATAPITVILDPDGNNMGPPIGPP